MKQSRYNLIFEHNNQKFVFNSMTCVLTKIDKDFLETLKLPNCIPWDENSKLINNMITAGYIN